MDTPTLSQSVFYAIGNEVVKFTEVRLNEFSEEWELLTTWLGVEDPTWEPATNMAQDVPTLFHNFCTKQKKDIDVQRMIKSLNIR
jgi:hypothetical protein